MSNPQDPSQRNGLPPTNTSQKQQPRMDCQRSRKKPLTPIINPETGLEEKKNILISVPYVAGLSEEFRIFCHTNIQVIFKSTNTLQSTPIPPKEKIQLHLKENLVYK